MCLLQRFNIAAALLFVVIVVVSGCAGSLYSHYPKVKKQQAAKPTAQEEVWEKDVLVAEQLNGKPITPQPANLLSPQKVKVILPLTPMQNQPVKNFTEPKVGENDSTILPTTDVVNKNAKIAFWSAIAILGSGAAAVLFGAFFLFLILVFAIVAFIFAVIALHQINRTGEYGKPKADFALVLSIPILIIVLTALIFLVAQGGLTLTLGLTI